MEPPPDPKTAIKKLKNIKMLEIQKSRNSLFFLYGWGPLEAVLLMVIVVYVCWMIALVDFGRQFGMGFMISGFQCASHALRA